MAPILVATRAGVSNLIVVGRHSGDPSAIAAVQRAGEWQTESLNRSARIRQGGHSVAVDVT